MNYFEIRLEDKQSQVDWLTNHRHDFLCKVSDRIGHAIENNLERVKLFEETIQVGMERKTIRKVGIYLTELKGGSFLTNTMLKHFERTEDYERCAKISEWINKLSST